MLRTRASRALYIAIACLLCASSVLCLCACDKNSTSFYANENDFEYTVTDGEDALVYEPKDVAYTYGLIFYVGTLISPSQYDYLGVALAKQGYLVVIPKLELNGTYNGYLEAEPAFAKYPNVKFYVGGHDIGGGAAIRRAQENPTSVVGTVLFTPIGYSKQVLGENGNLTYDEDGNVVKIVYSISSLSIPTLLLEADCEVGRTEQMALDAKSRLNSTVTEVHKLSNSSNLGFLSTLPEVSTLSEQQHSIQLDKTIEYTLAFLRRITLR